MIDLSHWKEYKSEGILKGWRSFGSSKWVCGDGDHAGFYVNIEEQKMELNCISGIHESGFVLELWNMPRSRKFRCGITEYERELGIDSANQFIDLADTDVVIEYYKWVAEKICELFCDAV